MNSLLLLLLTILPFLITSFLPPTTLSPAFSPLAAKHVRKKACAGHVANRPRKSNPSARRHGPPTYELHEMTKPAEFTLGPVAK